MSAAPKRMIRAGLGDSICRSTAQADWLLSHHALGTRYRRAPFDLLAHDEPVLLDEPEALLRGDNDAMLALARTLILSGLGMTICGGSYPASQGEHLISHYIDMFAPAGRVAHFHGEQVGVATLTMARLQQQLLAAGPPRLASTQIDCAALQRRFGDDVGASCWREFAAKPSGRDADAKLEARLAERWTVIRESVGNAMIPSQRIAAALRRAGCPTEPSQIGVTREFYDDAVRHARFLRDRYTFLDLAAAVGHPALADAR
jgi:glycerol-1-phosphate dehydrogenase [NAD(P)+]